MEAEMKGHLASERGRGRERRSKVGNEEYMGRMRVRERERQPLVGRFDCTL